MEILLKIGITLVTLVFIYYQCIFIKWVWTSQIDSKKTISKILKKAAPDTDTIATRDPNKIYQNGNVVGDITGQIEEKDNLIIFKQISNTSNLDQGVLFEYKRNKCRIIRINTSIGIKIVATNSGTERRDAVIEDVVCKKIE